MREEQGHLWTYHDDQTHPLHRQPYRVITTNGVLHNSGNLVMGRGTALQAKLRYPDLPKAAGFNVRNHGNVPGIFFSYRIITLPTKHHWRDKADIKLIRQSVQMLVNIVNTWNIKEVAMTRPGCANGGLLWADVKPVIAPMLDDRFVVLTPRGTL